MEYLQKNKKPLALLAGVVLLLGITNTHLFTYLTGWDNLQTDLNPLLGVKRAFFAVWQEYQSFGLMSGMAHGSDIIRSLGVALLSVFLPQQIIRYTVMYLALLIGGIGAYVFFSRQETLEGKNTSVWAFLGGLFYMLNIGTVQIFYLPFEPFSFFFASLPWLLWVFTCFINEKRVSKRTLVLFITVNLLATPSFYLQTLFVVYAIVTGCYFAGLLAISNRDRVISLLKKGVVAGVLILLTNAFWLLPQVYFVMGNSPFVTSSKINTLATDDVYHLNKEKGTVTDTIQLIGFYFDLYDKEGKPLFSPWKDHIASLPIRGIYILTACVVIAGLGVVQKKKLPFYLALFFPFTLLLTNTEIFSFVNEFLRSDSFINQIFRSTFTKVIIPYALLMSFFFASGAQALFRFFSQRFHVSLRIYAVCVTLAFCIYALPAFTGNFLSSEMRVAFPDDYHTTMQYFRTQAAPNARIALLPDYTFWGWFFHDWEEGEGKRGYNGSGFLWYGIEQPIISRTFDVWSEVGEGYFWEAKHAVESDSISSFESLIDKYDIDYILVDYTLLPVVASMRGLQYDRIEKILTKSSRVYPVYDGQSLGIYKTRRRYPSSSFLTLFTTPLPKVSPSVYVTNDDTAFSALGIYQSQERDGDYYYPFLDFFTQTSLPEQRWSIEQTEDGFMLRRELEIDIDEYDLVLSNSYEQALINTPERPYHYSSGIDLYSDGNSLRVDIKASQLLHFDGGNTLVAECGPVMNYESAIEGTALAVSSIDGSTPCFGYEYPYLEQQYGYMVRVNTKNREGRRPFFYVLDKTKKQSYVEDRISSDTEYYLLPPKLEYGAGYAFVFHNNSYKGIRSTNVIEGIDVYIFPYDLVKNIRFVRKGYTHAPLTTGQLTSADKHHYFLYSAIVPPASLPQTLALSQSYHTGWKGYVVPDTNVVNRYLPFWRGEEIGAHIKINNWKNGWELSPSDEGQKVVLIFWPQYLQFAGLGVLTIIAVWLFYMRKQVSYNKRIKDSDSE